MTTQTGYAHIVVLLLLMLVGISSILYFANSSATFTNKTYNYTFLYSPNKNIKQVTCDSSGRVASPGDEVVAFLPADSAIPTCVAFEWYNPVVIEVTDELVDLEEKIKKVGNNFKIQSQSIVVGGATGMHVRFTEFDYSTGEWAFGYPDFEQVYVNHNGHAYVFTLADSNDEQYKKLFEEVLSTFRFTNYSFSQ